MRQPYFELGPFTFYYYGLFIALGLFFYYLYLKKNSSLSGIEYSLTQKAFFVSLVFALIGGRLYHVLSSLPYYLLHPFEIFYLWQGGLGIFGAILGGLLGIYVFSLMYEIKLIKILNLIAPPLLLAQAIGRVGNFFNHESFGPPTKLPWKVFIPAVNRPPKFVSFSYFHPTFLYESVLCLLAFGVYIFLKKKLKMNEFGFGYYLLSYGLIRFLTEFLRLDTWKIFDFKLGFLASLIMIGSGVFLLFRRVR
ncbi:MAG TPA: prolipoprotein diacylglyceryl transferase [Clostridia bacterium]|nr:prolipoprotein diacylglyceryl transferase [Clostridia bacterium]